LAAVILLGRLVIINPPKFRQENNHRWTQMNTDIPGSASVPLQDEVLDFDEDFHAAGAPAPKNQKGPKTTDGLRWTQI
jgi:hypothetical protein